jgi:hypothetical protein
MDTILIWLLISTGSNIGGKSRPAQVVEYFASGAECQRVADILNDSWSSGTHRCIEARIVKKGSM